MTMAMPWGNVIQQDVLLIPVNDHFLISNTINIYKKKIYQSLTRSCQAVVLPSPFQHIL